MFFPQLMVNRHIWVMCLFFFLLRGSNNPSVGRMWWEADETRPILKIHLANKWSEPLVRGSPMEAEVYSWMPAELVDRLDESKEVKTLGGQVTGEP